MNKITRECPTCGTTVQPAWNFCPRCGANLRWDDWGELKKETMGFDPSGLSYNFSSGYSGETFTPDNEEGF
jgi:endogenous inhibitor of DNA gyrase (YacG/DUF329 family)